MIRRILFLSAILTVQSLHAEFKAGSAVIDITPPKLPVLVNGGMLSRYVDKLTTRIHARAIVATDGKTEIAIVVVDSCMMGRDFLDDAKKATAAKTGIPADRMLISATHAHSTPASMGCLGTDPDPRFPTDRAAQRHQPCRGNLHLDHSQGDPGYRCGFRFWSRSSPFPGQPRLVA